MRSGLVGLAVLVVVVLFTGLGSVGYLDVREARDQAVARELIGRRELFTPVLGGSPMLDKPVFGYAIDVVCALTAGTDPRAPRTVKAAGILALAFVTGWIAARRFGRRTGMLAAAVFLTCVGAVFAARSDGTQVMASLLGWIACAAFATPVLTGSTRAPKLLAGWAALGLALLIAGPFSALWPLLGVLLYLMLGRGFGKLATIRPLAGATLAIAIALPWYAASFERHGRDLLATLFSFPYAVTPRGSWQRGPLDAFISLIAAGFPWSAMLPFATLHARTWWRSRRPPESDPVAADPTFVVTAVEEQVRDASASHLVIAWLIAALVPLIVYPHPPLSAALPALPALAILCGRVLDHLFEVPRRVAVVVNGAAWVLAAVGSAGALFAALVANQMPGPAKSALLVLATVLLVTSCAPALAGFIRRPRIAALLFAAPVLIGVPIATSLTLPALEGWFNARAVVERMERDAPPGAALVVIDPPPPSLRIGLWHNLVRTPLERDAILEWRARDGAAYLAFRPARERTVVAALGQVPEVLVHTPVLVLARVR